MLNFPNSPTNGQTFTSGAMTWAFDGTKWISGVTRTDIPAPGAALPLMDGTAAAGTSLLYGRQDHVHPTDQSRVADTGDTMTGNLTISTNNWPSLLLNSLAAQQGDRQLIGTTGGKTRWSLALGTNEAESGSNAGSNFQINRCADDSSYLGAPLSINRATGVASFTQTITAPNGLLVQSGGSGGAKVSPGDASNAGYVRFYSPNGNSAGYIGWTNNNRLNLLAEGSTTGWYMGGTFDLTGQLSVDAAIQSTQGRVISKRNGGNPSFCCWDTSQSWAAGMFLGGGNLYFGNMGGDGAYVGPWYGRFDSSGNFWSYAATTATYLHSTGSCDIDGQLAANSELSAALGIRSRNFYGNRMEMGWDGGGYGQWQTRVDGGGSFNLVRGNAQMLNIEGGNWVYYFNGGYSFVTISGWSDRRLKRDVKPAGDALSVINRMQVHSAIVKQIEYRDAEENPGISPKVKVETEQQWPFALIADELDDVLPLARVRAPVPQEQPNEGEVAESYDRIDSYPIVAALVRGMQQLTERVVALEARLA